MSLHPKLNALIRAETRPMAQATFPNDTLCFNIADVLGSLYLDVQFATLFPDLGQPALSPARLAKVWRFAASIT